MLSAILTKLGFPLLLASAGFIGGLTFHNKVLNRPCPTVVCPPIPECICNPPAVSVQPFDVDKIKNMRSFTYSPSFQGSIQVHGVDSAFVGRKIRESIEQHLKK